MNTEITEYKGWVFYDGDCAMCACWAMRCHDLLLRRGFHLVPLQAPWVKQRLGLDERGLLAEMHLLTCDERAFGGADALVQIAGSVWWAWPVYVLGRLPGFKHILRALYRRIAVRRRCGSGKCQLPGRCEKRSGRRHITSAFYELP